MVGNIVCGRISPPLDSTHSRQRWAWNDITALGQNTVERRRVWHAISPFGNTLGRMTSSVACHHHLWEAQTVERRQAWHAIIAFGQHTRSNNVGRGMPSTPLNSTHDRMTSGVTCHHRSWTAHTVGRHRPRHDITALGLHAQSDDVGLGMTSPPLDSTHGRQCRAWHDITALGQHTRSSTSGME